MNPENIKEHDLICQNGEYFLVLKIWKHSCGKLAFDYICINDDFLDVDWLFLGWELRHDYLLKSEEWVQVSLEKIG